MPIESLPIVQLGQTVNPVGTPVLRRVEEQTAHGAVVPIPKRGESCSNLEKVAKAGSASSSGDLK